MTDSKIPDFNAASDAFDEAHQALAQHDEVLDALEDFVLTLAPAALELGVSLAPGGGALTSALKVAQVALPVVVKRLQASKTTPPPPPAKPGL